MYDFLTIIIYQKNNPNTKQLFLLYPDTASLIYHVFLNDAYTDLRSGLKAKFDTLHYPANNRFNYPCVNKKLIGYMRDDVAVMYPNLLVWDLHCIPLKWQINNSLKNYKVFEKPNLIEILKITAIVY